MRNFLTNTPEKGARRSIFLICLCLLSVPLVAAGESIWTAPQVIGSVTDGEDNIAAVSDALGRIHVAYTVKSANDLGYALYDNSTGWTGAIVESTDDVGHTPSIAVDSQNRPHIAHYDTANLNLRYAYFNGSNWIATALDATGDRRYPERERRPLPFPGA